MNDALKTFLPMFAFMFIPLWIPLIAVAVGSLLDATSRLRGGTRGTTSVTASGQHKAERVA